MSDRRKELLDVFLDLFNRGYENVPMQQIANALSISPGNLTYFFPKK